MKADPILKSDHFCSTFGVDAVGNQAEPNGSYCFRTFKWKSVNQTTFFSDIESIINFFINNYDIDSRNHPNDIVNDVLELSYPASTRQEY